MGDDVHAGHDGGPPEPWAGQFRNALRLRGRPETRVKWYLVLARRFSAFVSPGPLESATRADADSFLSTLSSRPGIADWQLDQAADALTILLGTVFGQAWALEIRAPAAPPPPDVPLPEGDEPLDRLRYAARCRRYSPRTEQAYVFWVNRFLVFCREGGVVPESGADIRTVQELLGHGDVSKTMICTRVLNRPGLAVRSPEDA